MGERALVWLTRPAADSAAFAAELALHHVPTLVAPVMRIALQSLDATSLPRPAGLLLTSRHAAHALAMLPADWRALPVYCVGAGTAESVAAEGFGNIIIGDSDVLGLLPAVVQGIPSGETLLYLCGEETRVDVGALLAAHGIQVHASIVYRALAETELAAALISALKTNRLTAVAFFSPRSAQLACALLLQQGLGDAARGVHACCLSLNVATAAAMLEWKSLQSCHLPTRAAMLELMVSQSGKTL